MKNTLTIVTFLLLTFFTSYKVTAQFNPRGPGVELLAPKELTDPITITHNNITYFVSEGMWYVQKNNRYKLVKAPVGAHIKSIPTGAKEIKLRNKTYYKFKGTVYEKVGTSYVVVKLDDYSIKK